MTDKQIKVGDVVAWDKVPSGALVRCEEGFAVRAYSTMGWWAFRPRTMPEWYVRHPHHMFFWGGGMHRDTMATIISLDIPADATADDLRALAERFEVREAWEALMLSSRSEETEGNDAVKAWFADNTRNARIFIARLHRAGWRPGMTAEDAARLLAEAAEPGPFVGTCSEMGGYDQDDDE